jgi:hypothetical protein
VGSAVVEHLDAGLADGREIVNEIAQEQQVDEVPVAGILTACWALSHGVDLLGDLIADGHDCHVARAVQAELVDADGRRHDLGIAALASLRCCDLHGQRLPRAAVEDDLDRLSLGGGLADVHGLAVASEFEPGVGLEERLVQCVAQICQRSAEHGIEVLGGSCLHAKAELHGDAALDQEPRIVVLVRDSLERADECE